MSFVLKDQVKMSPWVGEENYVEALVVLEGLRSLLNTEGILTLPMFLLSDGSLIWMWSASFAQWCRVLLSLSIIVKSLSSAFGCFVEMWWFLMALVIDFYDMKLFLSGTCWFHLCIQLCTCQLGISSGKLYQFSVHLELHHRAKEALYIHIKDPSLNRNIGKVRIPLVFNKLPKPSRQLELPHSSIPPPKGTSSSLGLSTQKTINTSHLLDLHLQ